MTLNHTSRATIVGGGFTGLTAAYELASRGIPVTVLEAESEIGGLERMVIGKGPGFRLQSHLLQLAEEAGRVTDTRQGPQGAPAQHPGIAGALRIEQIAPA